MTNQITATFSRRRFHDSGKDQVPDYNVYEFTDIVDSKGMKFGDKWIKETKLMQVVPFKKGKEYQIKLSNNPFSEKFVNLPFPVEVSWDEGKVYIRGGNSIIRVDKNGQEKNLSVPINKILGSSNYETSARNKFGKGLLSEELLLKMNSRGVFYFVHFYDPQDKRKDFCCEYGSTNKGAKNYILIQKETQKEINRDLKTIKQDYVTKEIEKYFEILTKILEPKKKKGK